MQMDETLNALTEQVAAFCQTSDRPACQRDRSEQRLSP